MNQLFIRENICVESKYLDKNILQHIERQVRADKIKQCTKKQGFIREVSNFTIFSSKISMADCNNVFNIEYQAMCIKPTVGVAYQGSILFCQGSRIFFNIDNLFQILVTNGIRLEPMDNIKTPYTFEKCKCIIDGDDHQTLIDHIRIDVVEFKNGNFISLGSHVH